MKSETFYSVTKLIKRGFPVKGFSDPCPNFKRTRESAQVNFLIVKILWFLVNISVVQISYVKHINKVVDVIQNFSQNKFAKQNIYLK